MKYLTGLILIASALLSFSVSASDGYKITGQAGMMFFVSIESDQKDNEDVYRFAVADACAGKRICQVQYWVGSAPNKFPLTDVEVNSKLVQWQLNLNTGLRRWLVKCSASNLFPKERECM